MERLVPADVLGLKPGQQRVCPCARVRDRVSPADDIMHIDPRFQRLIGETDDIGIEGCRLTQTPDDRYPRARTVDGIQPGDSNIIPWLFHHLQLICDS